MKLTTSVKLAQIRVGLRGEEDCCRAARATLDVEHWGIVLDWRALHAYSKHVRLSSGNASNLTASFCHTPSIW